MRPVLAPPGAVAAVAKPQPSAAKAAVVQTNDRTSPPSGVAFAKIKSVAAGAQALLGGLLAPVAVQPRVVPAQLEQLVVRPLLDDLAVLEHDDPAGLAD